MSILNKRMKWFFVGIALIVFTSCGSNNIAEEGVIDDTNASQELIAKQIASDKVINYILTKETAPTVQDYIDLGVTTVNENNLTSVNQKALEFANLLEEKIEEVVVDAAPRITLVGSNLIYLKEGDSYEEFGATATDDLDGDLTDTIVITGEVDTEEIGVYKLTYTVLDSSENTASISRTVSVTAEEAAGNMRPNAAAGPDQTIALGETVFLDGTGSFDTDGTIEKYSWLIDGERFVLSYESTHSYEPSEAGEFTIYMNIEDDDGGKAADIVIITVVDNTPTPTPTPTPSPTPTSTPTPSPTPTSTPTPTPSPTPTSTPTPSPTSTPTPTPSPTPTSTPSPTPL